MPRMPYERETAQIEYVEIIDMLVICTTCNIIEYDKFKRASFYAYFFGSCLLNDKVPGILFHFLLMTNFMGLPDWCFHV